MDDSSLELTLKPLLKSLLKWLKAIYILGFIAAILGLIIFLVLLVFKGLLDNFLGDSNSLYNFMKSPFALIFVGWLYAISKSVYKIYKALKKHQLSASKTDFVASFYRLKLFFRLLFFLIIYLIIFMFFKYGVSFIPIG